MKKDDSKMAFPLLSVGINNKGVNNKGMTLFDYYVGKAIQGMMANPNFDPFEDTYHMPEIVSTAMKVAEEAIKQKRDNYVQ